MLKRVRAVVLCIATLICTALIFLWWRSGPKIVGRLPRKDVRAIQSLLEKNEGTLGTAVRRRSSDDLADWLLNHRDGRLIRLDVQSSNRVFAFLAAGEAPQGRLLILERSTNGWYVAQTNDRVIFR
jgi:hypothetical protein